MIQIYLDGCISKGRIPAEPDLAWVYEGYIRSWL